VFKDHAPKPASGAVARARKLRKEMSLPEVLLWRLLRGQPQGVKFRRQHPSGELGIDFYCSDANLVIEIDGISHDMGDRPQRDMRRDAWLKSEGLDTMRIAAKDVLKDAVAVADGIIGLALSIAPPPSGCCRTVALPQTSWGRIFRKRFLIQSIFIANRREIVGRMLAS
jgi:very-short-patch-repair endonuclease